MVSIRQVHFTNDPNTLWCETGGSFKQKGRASLYRRGGETDAVSLLFWKWDVVFSPIHFGCDRSLSGPVLPGRQKVCRPMAESG